MTQNELQLWPEIATIIGGVLALFLFAVAIALPNRPKTLPGSSGHRSKDEEEEHEEIRPDGYIDSFSGEIEEAGGGLPLVVKLALVGVILWWVGYLILNWTPR
jgi:hypothetical protein